MRLFEVLTEQTRRDFLKKIGATTAATMLGASPAANAKPPSWEKVQEIKFDDNKSYDTVIDYYDKNNIFKPHPGVVATYYKSAYFLKGKDVSAGNYVTEIQFRVNDRKYSAEMVNGNMSDWKSIIPGSTEDYVFEKIKNF